MGVKKTVTRAGPAILLIAGLAISPSMAQAADNSTSIDGLTTGPIVQPAWVVPGKHVQHPHEGGTWEYGFWNVKYRSYYTVNRCHGTTVKSGSRTSRSVDTASGKKSIAELWAINNPGADPHYHYRVC